MNAREYIPDWLSKKYWDVKEIGDWTPEDVVEFTEAYHKQATKPTKTVTDEEIADEIDKRYPKDYKVDADSIVDKVIKRESFYFGAKWLNDKRAPTYTNSFPTEEEICEMSEARYSPEEYNEDKAFKNGQRVLIKWMRDKANTSKG